MVLDVQTVPAHIMTLLLRCSKIIMTSKPWEKTCSPVSGSNLYCFFFCPRRKTKEWAVSSRDNRTE